MAAVATGPSGLSADLSEHHEAKLVEYLRFASLKRKQGIREVQASFDDVRDMKLLEDTYTLNEVKEIMQTLENIVKTNIEGELMSSAHMNVLLLRQMFGQADRWHLKLQCDIGELENKDLLEMVKRFEDSQLSGTGVKKMSVVAGGTSKLPALPNSLNVDLLDNEIERLKNELADAQLEKKDLLDQVQKLMSGSGNDKLDAAGEVAKTLRRELESTRQELLRKEGALEQIKEDYARMRSEGAAGGSATSTTIVRENASHLNELLESNQDYRKALEEIAQLKKELNGNVNDSTPFQNMRKMLNKKNKLIHTLRDIIAEHAPNAPLPGDE